MPDFYSVKLDVNQIKREIHFWNQQTSYINALHSDSIPNYIAGRKSIVGRCGGRYVPFSSQDYGKYLIPSHRHRMYENGRIDGQGY